MTVQCRLLFAASLVVGALALGALLTLATPKPAEAFGRSSLPACFDCSTDTFVFSCAGCSGSGGGQCNNCGSCRNQCGGQGDNGSCWCDADCVRFGDCCHDQAYECSCAGRCGEWAASCWCDFDCHGFGDCCEDKVLQCGACDPTTRPSPNNPDVDSFCWHGSTCCGTEWVCGSSC